VTASLSTSHQLQRLPIGDSAAAWEAAGFVSQTLPDGLPGVVVGQTALVLAGGDKRGLHGLGLAGAACPDLDIFDASESRAGRVIDHPNGVGSIDHVVMMTGDCDATTSLLTACGLVARRVRRFEAGGLSRRQAFFWIGDVILELVGPDDAEPEPDPPSLWGLALNCPDLDATVAELGPERCSEARDAIQPGRRIATMRTRDLDVSVAIALMSPHVARST